MKLNQIDDIHKLDKNNDVIEAFNTSQIDQMEWWMIWNWWPYATNSMYVIHIVAFGPYQYWKCGWNVKLVKINDRYQMLQNAIDGMDE